MKIRTVNDRRTYAGSPVDIVRKLRSRAVHLATRSEDDYVNRVIDCLRSEWNTALELDGETLEARCEALLVALIREGLAVPEFHLVYLDAHAIRVLRKARGLSQGELGSAIGASTAVVAGWEAGEQAPTVSETLNLQRELFDHFLTRRN